MSEATPRPWKLEGVGSNVQGNGIYTEDGYGIVATYQCPGSRQHHRSLDDILAEGDANGTLIVEAVNAHDRLQCEHEKVGSVAGLLNAAETFDLDAFNFIEPDENADRQQLWSTLLEPRQWLREAIKAVKQARQEV